MKPLKARNLLTAVVVFSAGSLPGFALDVIKADNTNGLNLGTSWALGTAPGTGDVATWSGMYNTAGSLSSSFSASTPVSWQGIKIGSLSALIDTCAAIAAEAPSLPFYYYDIPVLTGVSFPMEKFLTEAPARIPNLAGIKFTNPDLVSYRRSLDVAGNRLDLPWGVDEMLVAALATGARGGVGSTYNWAPKLYLDLIDAFQRGDLDEARRLQSVSIAMIDAIAATGFLGSAKALMARLGVPVGAARLPLGNPSEAQVDALMIRLGELGFAEWGAKPLPQPALATA